MRKITLETIRLYDFSRRNPIDVEKITEAVDDVYRLEDQEDRKDDDA